MHRVLMIDDDQQVSAVLAMAIEALGYQVTMSNETENAEQICAEAKPDLILLDMMMPGRSGIELLKPLKEICPDSVICMMTGLVDDNLLSKSLHAGAWNILYKPYTIAELNELLQLSELLSNAVRQEKESERTSETLLSLTWPGDKTFDEKDIAAIVRCAANAGAKHDLANRRIPVVASELLANARVHGAAQRSEHTYGLSCSADPKAILLKVNDSGDAFNWNSAVNDFGSTNAGGSALGLQLVRALSDSLSYDESNKTVQALFNL